MEIGKIRPPLRRGLSCSSQGNPPLLDSYVVEVRVALGPGRPGSRRRLERRWRAFWTRSGARGDPGTVFVELDRRYREPHRHYHTWEHIEECLQLLEWARHLADDPAAVEMALWFHDAVYDPRGGDNEERSARLARESAAAMGLREQLAERIGELILVTRVGAPEPDRGSSDALVVGDVDLAILGRSPRRYRRYEAAIRREYAWVPVEEFRRRRAAILQGLLARPRLYATDLFRSRFEARARANLHGSLRRLGFPVRPQPST